ncbi:hypothetical protein L210DRAFT_3509848 [Boletus edulis BED1]|uniref:Uncharacterized protein n=1 Tax=Boletus edulis BED1 TaxID=1328754 RepID=A0AAD4BEL5_BOLED|nr:hypothetical protein L210DRAFT_3509848 [Boletus edulis BED1]
MRWGADTQLTFSLESEPNAAHVQHAHNRWPNQEYTVDVINGITKMGSDILKHLSQARQFEHVFKCPYVKSTYNDACKQWQLASQDLQDRLLAAGWTSGGRWTVLTRAVKLKRSKQPKDDGDTSSAVYTPVLPSIDLTTDDGKISSAAHFSLVADIDLTTD